MSRAVLVAAICLLLAGAGCRRRDETPIDNRSKAGVLTLRQEIHLTRNSPFVKTAELEATEWAQVSLSEKTRCFIATWLIPTEYGPDTDPSIEDGDTDFEACTIIIQVGEDKKGNLTATAFALIYDRIAYSPRRAQGIRLQREGKGIIADVSTRDLHGRHASVEDLFLSASLSGNLKINASSPCDPLFWSKALGAVRYYLKARGIARGDTWLRSNDEFSEEEKLEDIETVLKLAR